MPVPDIFLLFGHAQNVFQIQLHPQVVDGMDITGNDINQFQYSRTLYRIFGSQAGLRIAAIKIIENGQ